MRAIRGGRCGTGRSRSVGTACLAACTDTRALTNEADRPTELFGHVFANPALLREALTHRSAAGRGGEGSNERLEFVGDRVLGLIVAEWLIERFPDEQEGKLGPRLAHLVSRSVLAEVAREVGLADVLSVASGEVRAGVRERPTVLADALEAAIGAMYLDGGLPVARDFIRRVWAPRMEQHTKPPKDPKTALQEHALARGWGLPAYSLLGREGPAHDPVFRVGVAVPGHRAQGEGSSKQAAERAAASGLMDQLQDAPG
jgi:ribonuclease III